MPCSQPEADDLPAYRGAWADGEPYVRWWQLQRARAVFAAIGEPEPQLPPFDPSKMKPFPFEAKLLAYIEEKRAEKAEREAKASDDQAKAT